MTNEDLLKELAALRAGQEKLLALVAAKESADPAPELPGCDLGKIYRTQGRAAMREALREQNKARAAEYRRRGLAV